MFKRFSGKKAKVNTTISGAVASSLVIIRPNPERVNCDYLMFALDSPSIREQLIKANNGSSQPNLSAASVRQYCIELPRLELQNNIVQKLTKLRSIITHRKQQLLKLDELVKARFVEMFGDCRTNPKGWGTVALGDISDVGSSKRVFVEELQEKGIPFYRGTEIGALAEGKSISPELFITEEHYNTLIEASGKPEIGDLLMPSICPDGRIWVVDSDEPFYFKDGRVLWVHSISENYDPIFLLYTLKDRIMTDYGSIASGTTFAELKIFALKQCKVFDVPLEEQHTFAKFIAQIDKSKFTAENLQRLIRRVRLNDQF
ncbi:MAG: EcoKI restriction-modification system protein HsdS [Firmicutes bacterium ADurb.BinA205]|nr:MAG: EcoKI restriction-modification system protein HsdS [Firmicutes bacterium ADurb.BinA205]